MDRCATALLQFLSLGGDPADSKDCAELRECVKTLREAPKGDTVLRAIGEALLEEALDESSEGAIVGRRSRTLELLRPLLRPDEPEAEAVSTERLEQLRSLVAREVLSGPTARAGSTTPSSTRERLREILIRFERSLRADRSEPPRGPAVDRQRPGSVDGEVSCETHPGLLIRRLRDRLATPTGSDRP